MNTSKYWNFKRLKDSASIALTLFAVFETIIAISSINLNSLWGIYSWYTKLLIVIGLFIILMIIVYIVIYFYYKNSISLKIRGINIEIKQGDLFKEPAWKVIPFNEYFDTEVDDKIIAHNTLNGMFIDNYVDDIENLRQVINNLSKDSFSQKKKDRKGKTIYKLGQIITYNDYMLLALTHFDNNTAYLSQSDYEQALRFMWKEISRTYANKPIVIPLLGAGITRFSDIQMKSKTDLLKCMLCTLKSSMIHINQKITIVLTKEVLEEIDIYEFKN